MFTIALKPEQYQTYILTDEEAQSRLEIVPERGGMVTRWRIQGQDILYLDEERFANPDMSVRGGIPILFPICGNLPNNTYTHSGQQYTLKQHGFARDLPWQIQSQNNQDCASLTLLLHSNEQTYQVYPFNFQLTFTYKLKGNTLTVQQRYTNLSQERMPFSSGLHPYFLATNKEQLDLDIPATQYQDQITKEVHSFSGNFDMNQDEIDVALFPLSRQSASYTDLQRRLKMTLNYSTMYSTVVFWTVKGKDYICLEPWTSPRNALNTGDHLQYLEPGNSCEAIVKLEVNHL